MVEGARLESVYTSKGYRGFESLSLRITEEKFLVYIFQNMKDFSFYVGDRTENIPSSTCIDSRIFFP